MEQYKRLDIAYGGDGNDLLHLLHLLHLRRGRGVERSRHARRRPPPLATTASRAQGGHKQPRDGSPSSSSSAWIATAGAPAGSRTMARPPDRIILRRIVKLMAVARSIVGQEITTAWLARTLVRVDGGPMLDAPRLGAALRALGFRPLRRRRGMRRPSTWLAPGARRPRVGRPRGTGRPVHTVQGFQVSRSPSTPSPLTADVSPRQPRRGRRAPPTLRPRHRLGDHGVVGDHDVLGHHHALGDRGTHHVGDDHHVLGGPDAFQHHDGLVPAPRRAPAPRASPPGAQRAPPPRATAPAPRRARPQWWAGRCPPTCGPPPGVKRPDRSRNA